MTTTTVYVEACCAPAIDDDDIDRLMDALPVDAAMITRVDGGAIGATFDMTVGVDDWDVLHAGMAMFSVALRTIGMTPTRLACEVVDEPAGV